MLGFNSASQSDAATAGLFALGFTSFDPTFSLIKFIQGTKLVTRHRFVGVEHGRLFTAYQTQANQRFDHMSKLSFNEIYSAQNGYKSKFTVFRSPVSMFEYKTIPVIIYLFAWLLKVISYVVINRVAARKEVSKFHCYFILVQQKFSFLMF